LIGTAIGLVASIGQSTDPTNPYYQRKEPNYLAVVDARIALHAAEYKAIRKTVIDHSDLQVLEIWLSEGAMYAVYSALPITTWQQLADVEYVSATSTTGKPRAAVSTNVATEFRFLFDLPNGNDKNIWPWS
jgi:hypothetical protein